MLTKINKALEVRDAMKVAREGVPGMYEEARIKGIVTRYNLISSEPNCSVEVIREQVMCVKYETYLKAGYPNASDKSVKEAARNVAILDSRYCKYNSPEYQEAVRSVRYMIDEHKTNSKLVSSLRK